MREGKIKPNDEIRQYLHDNRYVIEFAETAAGVRDCDWGYDISKGFDVLLPELSKIRMTAYLLTAKAQILAKEGDYKAALGKYLTIHRMARHLGDRMLISYLVGNALNALANKRIEEILSGQSITRVDVRFVSVSNLVDEVHKAPRFGRRDDPVQDSSINLVTLHDLHDRIPGRDTGPLQDVLEPLTRCKGDHLARRKQGRG